MTTKKQGRGRPQKQTDSNAPQIMGPPRLEWVWAKELDYTYNIRGEETLKDDPEWQSFVSGIKEANPSTVEPILVYKHGDKLYCINGRSRAEAQQEIGQQQLALVLEWDRLPSGLEMRLKSFAAQARRGMTHWALRGILLQEEGDIWLSQKDRNEKEKRGEAMSWEQWAKKMAISEAMFHMIKRVAVALPNAWLRVCVQNDISIRDATEIAKMPTGTPEETRRRERWFEYLTDRKELPPANWPEQQGGPTEKKESEQKEPEKKEKEKKEKKEPSEKKEGEQKEPEKKEETAKPPQSTPADEAFRYESADLMGATPEFYAQATRVRLKKRWPRSVDNDEKVQESIRGAVMRRGAPFMWIGVVLSDVFRALQMDPAVMQSPEKFWPWVETAIFETVTTLERDCVDLGRWLPSPAPNKKEDFEPAGELASAP